MNILAISPHADDAELWAGGSIARWINEEHGVGIVTVTHSNGRADELRASLELLYGETWEHQKSPVGYVDTGLHNDRQRLLNDFVAIRKALKQLDLVLCPSSLDMHQDHRTVYEEAFRAFRGVSTLGYDVPYNSHTHVHPFYVEITEADLERKLAACACYESEQHKRYFDPDVIRGLAKLRGAEIGVPLAEAFEVIRWKM